MTTPLKDKTEQLAEYLFKISPLFGKTSGKKPAWDNISSETRRKYRRAAWLACDYLKRCPKNVCRQKHGKLGGGCCG